MRIKYIKRKTDMRTVARYNTLVEKKVLFQHLTWKKRLRTKWGDVCKTFDWTKLNNIQLTSSVTKFIKFDCKNPKASQKDLVGRWHSRCKTVSNSMKRMSNAIFGFDGVEDQKLYLIRVAAAASHRQSWILQLCCVPI